MNSFLLWIGGLLVAVLGLLFAAPLVIDWNAYRGVFEEEATRILGRDVRVGGKVDLRLLPSPYVRFEQIRISDAGASLGEPFFRAEGFKLWLAPTPLLRGAIEATELELDRPVLRLAVDDQGRGNWQALRITPGSLPFMPSDIVLQQVRVRQGLVSLKTPGTAEPLTLSGIEGEVAAASLDGPFRFRGTIDWYGSPRELRINTAQREADGKLRYKATIRAVDSANVYAIDGQLSDTSVKARNTGTLTAKLPLAGVIGSASSQRSARTAEVVDLTASFDGDLDGIKLDNMAFAFEQNGKPQLMSGVASANWSKGLRLETRLASRWLDLDQLAGTAANGAVPHPVELARRLLGQAAAALPADGTSLLTIDVDQVNLGGAALGGLRLALARTGGLTSVGELKAALPGNARVELRGTLAKREPRQADTPDELPFDGEIHVRGASAQRLASWAGLGAMLAKGPGGDTPFSVSGRLGLRAEGIAFQEASGELSGKPLTGGFEWTWEKARRLNVVLEGRSVDLTAVFPGIFYAAGLPDESGRIEPALLASTVSRVAAVNRAVGDMRIQIRAGELTDGTTKLQDVDADIEVRNDALVISSLKLGTSQAARIDVAGSLATLSTRPAGTLRGTFFSASPGGLSDVLRVLPDAGQSLARHLVRDVTRVDTAFTLDLGGKPDERLTLTTSGRLDATSHRLTLVLDGGAARWRDAPIELKLDLDGPDAGTLFQRLSSATAPDRRAPAQRPARVMIGAAGAKADRLVASAALDVPQVGTAIFRGNLSLAPDASVTIEGDVAVEADDSAEMISFWTGGERPALSGGRLSGNIAIERAPGVTQLATSNLTIGSNEARGRVRLTSRDDRTRVDATVSTRALDVAALLGLALDGRAPAAGSSPSEAAPAWSDQPFAMTRFANLEGAVKITSPAASLGDGLDLADAEINLGLTPGRIEISSLTGAAMGGRLTLRGSIEQAPGGATATLDLRMTGAMLDRFAGLTATTAQAGTRGTVNITANIAGRSLSPRSLVASLKGTGEIELRGARVSGVSPSLVERVARTWLEMRDEPTPDRLGAGILAESARSTIDLGNQRLRIDVADGVVRIAPLTVNGDEASLRNVTTVDLVALKADSEWQIQARRPWKSHAEAKRADPLATISLVWSGGLASIAARPPKATFDALERDLGLRRIERETDRLEDLRRQDEERVRVERARQEEAARAAVPPAGLNASPPAPQAPGTPAASPPVIQAPLPIPQQAAPAAGGQPDAGPGTPLPRVIRPPAPKSSSAIRSLEDVFTGR